MLDQRAPNIESPIDEVMDVVRNDPTLYGIAQRLRWILKQEAEEEIERKEAQIERLQAKLAEARARQRETTHRLRREAEYVRATVERLGSDYPYSDTEMDAIAHTLDAIADLNETHDPGSDGPDEQVPVDHEPSEAPRERPESILDWLVYEDDPL